MERWLILIFLVPFVVSEITMSDGYWTTTFDTIPEEQPDHNYDGIDVCDGIEWSGLWTIDGLKTSVTADANNPASNGLGVRFWKGSGLDNSCSGTMAAQFPVQNEIWVRWYERYESEFEWAGGRIDVKSLYFHSEDASHPYVGYQYDDYRFYWGGAGGGPTFPRSDSIGWNDVYTGGVSDGSWHFFEVYMKMDTNGTDGIGRIWIDGKLVADHDNFSWSGFNNHPGWTYFTFLSNQKDPELDKPYYVDFDDLAIATPEYSGFVLDNSSNKMIGPVKYVTLQDVIAGINAWRQGAQNIQNVMELIQEWKTN